MAVCDLCSRGVVGWSLFPGQTYFLFRAVLSGASDASFEPLYDEIICAQNEDSEQTQHSPVSSVCC